MPPKKNQKTGLKKPSSDNDSVDHDTIRKQNKDGMNALDDWNPINIFGKFYINVLLF